MAKAGNRRDSLAVLWQKEKSDMTPDPTFDAKVLGDALEAYARSKEEEPREAGRKGRMTSRLILWLKWALIPAAAAVLVLLLNPFGQSGVAWGKVVERVEKARTIVIHQRSYWHQEGGKTNDALVSENILYISREHGFRMDVLVFGKETKRLYIRPDDGKNSAAIFDIKTGSVERQFVIGSDGKTGAAIDPKTGKSQPIVAPDLDVASENFFSSDPKRMVKNFLSRPYKKIGKNRIEGRQVEGIEVQFDNRVQDAGKKMFNKKCERLWVDVATGLPFRTESTREFFDKVDMIMVQDYQWNVPLDPSLFQIPDPANAPEKK